MRPQVGAGGNAGADDEKGPKDCLTKTNIRGPAGIESKKQKNEEGGNRDSNKAKDVHRMAGDS